MSTLFLDIETIPADEEKRETLAYLYERKQEKRRKKGGEGDAPACRHGGFRAVLLSTSFDGAFGRILCIGYAFDDGPVEALGGTNGRCSYGSGNSRGRQSFCGAQRDGVRPAVHLPTVDGPWDTAELKLSLRGTVSPIYDTMKEWVQWGWHSVGLEHLALALGYRPRRRGSTGHKCSSSTRRGGSTRSSRTASGTWRRRGRCTSGCGLLGRGMGSGLVSDSEFSGALEEVSSTNQKRFLRKLALAALSSVPWVGGFLATMATLTDDEGQSKTDSDSGWSSTRRNCATYKKLWKLFSYAYPHLEMKYRNALKAKNIFL